MQREELNEILCGMGAEGSLLLEGYDDAVIGVTTDGRVVYDYAKMVQVLYSRDGLEKNMAKEWVDNNPIASLDYVPEDQRPVVILLIKQEMEQRAPGD